MWPPYKNGSQICVGSISLEARMYTNSGQPLVSALEKILSGGSTEFFWCLFLFSFVDYVAFLIGPNHVIILFYAILNIKLLLYSWDKTHLTLMNYSFIKK